MSANETTFSSDDLVSVDINDEEEESTSAAKHRRECDSRLKRRHYKKDSRFLLDLYTLTFDEDQTVDEIETCKTRIVSTPGNEMVQRLTSLNDAEEQETSYQTSTTSKSRSMSLFERGPQSLGHFSNTPSRGLHHATRSGSIPSLETNLLKILARKIQDSEEISFRKAKLLTKAYYQMLRSNNNNSEMNSLTGTFGGHPQYSSLVVTSTNNLARPYQQPKSFSPSVNRLSWQTLIRSSSSELKRMIGGLENTAKVLNEYLVDLLLEKNDLKEEQDEMLEEISEMTDQLLTF